METYEITFATGDRAYVSAARMVDVTSYLERHGYTDYSVQWHLVMPLEQLVLTCPPATFGGKKLEPSEILRKAAFACQEESKKFDDLAWNASMVLANAAEYLQDRVKFVKERVIYDFVSTVQELEERLLSSAGQSELLSVKLSVKDCKARNGCPFETCDFDEERERCSWLS